jgi:hypothetical protein
MLVRERERLSKLKQRLVELFDDYLREIEFYKFGLDFATIKEHAGITAWTPNNKEAFIQRYFRLDPTLSILSMPDGWFMRRFVEDESMPIAFGIKKSIRIRPLKLLILIWSYALRRGAKISWRDMNGLLVWFSENYRNPILNEFYRFPARGMVGEDVLRRNWIRYKDSQYYEVARIQFQGIFEVQTKIGLSGKIEELKSIVNSKGFESPRQYSKAWARFFCLVALFPDIFSPLYDELSTENLFPDIVPSRF